MIGESGLDERALSLCNFVFLMAFCLLLWDCEEPCRLNTQTLSSRLYNCYLCIYLSFRSIHVRRTLDLAYIDVLSPLFIDLDWFNDSIGLSIYFAVTHSPFCLRERNAVV
ncbi:hypothetical protein RclHR1_05940007 [Rhizophagus clarus]|uniref:EXS domain-containing protein n=1 Tax=Rhizophagus clarus TaxID=94130 RepID=A0A2Z6RPV6_9GLOM|nr:hypothetical protein RclHR1_05940007 [Rhizophagus clarus]GES76439.1 hypothetical protein RCL_e22083_RclHR1_05940007 [Rhizophagus clarus]